MPETGARAILLNRALIVLGFIGLFVSGYLSYVKFSKYLPMCGGSGGCLAVTDHPSAFWFGQPVAYFGLAGYLAITGLAVVREVTGRELSKPLVGLGLLLSTFGFFASGYLMYTAFSVIGETCKWCIGSAVTMLLTFVGHVLLFGQASDAQRPVYRSRPMSVPFVLAGLVLTATAIALTPNEGGATVRDVKLDAGTELVPAGSNILGEVDAPVTIVEFADFCCPACRATAISTRNLVKKYPGKVRLVFRHFPLYDVPGHQMAYPLAIASEFAAKSGKFWTFHEAAMTSPEVPTTIDQVLAIAHNIGLDEAALGKLLPADQSSDEFKQVYDDFSEGNKLRIGGTPSFFVQLPNGVTKNVKFSDVEKQFDTGQFAAYVH